MPRETFTVVLYSLTLAYKTLIIVFSVVPWAALEIVA